jgi:hypothetical protein
MWRNGSSLTSLPLGFSLLPHPSTSVSESLPFDTCQDYRLGYFPSGPYCHRRSLFPCVVDALVWSCPLASAAVDFCRRLFFPNHVDKPSRSFEENQTFTVLSASARLFTLFALSGLDNFFVQNLSLVTSPIWLDSQGLTTYISFSVDCFPPLPSLVRHSDLMQTRSAVYRLFIIQHRLSNINTNRDFPSNEFWIVWYCIERPITSRN